MADKETFRWSDALDNVVAAYNNRGHRSIANLSPNQAEREEHKNLVASTLRQHYFQCKEPANKRPKFSVNDVVRVKVNYGQQFRHGYDENWSQKLYKVARVYRRLPQTMYELNEYEGGLPVRGRFYESELQLSVDDGEFRVLEVLTRRVRNGVPQLFVRFRGFERPEWINEAQITGRFQPGRAQRAQHQQQQQQRQRRRQ